MFKFKVNPLSSTPGIFFTIFMFIGGVLLIVGNYKRWVWLVDPPENSFTTLFYSHYHLKKLCGKKYLIYFNYILGTYFILVVIWVCCDAITS